MRKIPLLFLLVLLTSAAYAADISSLAGVTGKIGQEDINYGTGQDTDTFTVPSYDGGTITLTKPPNPDASSKSIIKGIWFVSAMSGDHGNAGLPGSIAWILAQVLGENRVIELPGNQTYQVSTNLTIPSSITLRCQKGAIFSVDSGKTLTINGPFEADIMSQHFSGSGAVVFGSQPIVYPKWWGAVGNGSTNDLTAVQASFNSVPAGATVFLTNGTYLINAGASQYILLWPNIDNVKLTGAGAVLVLSSTHATASGIYLAHVGSTVNGVTIEDMIIRGPDDGANVPKDLVRFATTTTNVRIKHVEFSYSKTEAIAFQTGSASGRILIEDCYFHDICVPPFGVEADGVIIYAGTGGNLTINRNVFEDLNTVGGLTQHAIYISNGTNHRITANYFSGENARIQVYTGTATVVYNVIISDNISDGVTTHFFFDCSNLLITKNHFTDSSVRFGTDLAKWKVSDNVFDGNPSGSYPVQFSFSVSDGEFTGNRVVNGDKGLLFETTANNITIAENRIVVDGAIGINITSTGDGIKILNNYVESVTHQAIKFDSVAGSNHVVVGNTLSASTYAIHDAGSNGATYKIRNNVALAGTYALCTNFPLTGTATLASGTKAVSLPSTLADSNYRVALSGQENETFYVSAKSTSSFTITSSNGSSTAVVEYIVTY